MFQFPGFAPAHYGFMCRSGRSQGFPHSEIFGSKLVRSSPKLIAAYHVLHRLSAPRHPQNALKSLDRSHYRRPSLVSRTEISAGPERWPSIERLVDCARFACRGRSSATAAARGSHLLRDAADKSLLHDVNERKSHRDVPRAKPSYMGRPDRFPA
jgi:hypothetical protein